MRKVLFVCLLSILIGCKSKRITADSPEKFTVENFAGILSDNKLQEVFPEAEMEEGVSLFEEGTVKRAYTKIFSGTPDEALIIWEDTGREKIHQIRFDNDGRWRTKTGLAVGTSYEDLVRMNGGAIDLYGFGWDYSGAVNWNGGKMENSNFRVFLAPEGTAPNKFIGDHVINPTPEELEELQLKVTALIYQEEP